MLKMSVEISLKIKAKFYLKRYLNPLLTVTETFVIN